MSPWEELRHTLGSPPGYLSPLSKQPDSCLHLVSGEWMRNVLENRTLPSHFATHPLVKEPEVFAFLADKQCPLQGWLLILVKSISIPQHQTVHSFDLTDDGQIHLRIFNTFSCLIIVDDKKIRYRSDMNNSLFQNRLRPFL